MDPVSIGLMGWQKAQHTEQMIESTSMAMANSRQEHQQKMLGQMFESFRAIANDQTKRASEAQADAAALLKDTSQKLDSASSA